MEIAQIAYAVSMQVVPESGITLLWHQQSFEEGKGGAATLLNIG